MMTTFSEKPRKDEIPEPVSFATLLKRWVLGLFVACVLAVVVYALLTKSDETSLRAAGQRQNSQATRAIPVVAAAAKPGDIVVYLSGLGRVIPLNPVMVRSPIDVAGFRCRGYNRNCP